MFTQLLFQAQIKENSKAPRHWTLCWEFTGDHRWLVNSPHKWPVTRKLFPFDDSIMPMLWIVGNHDPWNDCLFNLPALITLKRIKTGKHTLITNKSAQYSTEYIKIFQLHQQRIYFQNTKYSHSWPTVYYRDWHLKGRKCSMKFIWGHWNAGVRRFKFERVVFLILRVTWFDLTCW